MDLNDLYHTSNRLRDEGRWQELVQLLAVDHTYWIEFCRGFEHGTLLCYNLFMGYYYLQNYAQAAHTLTHFATWLYPLSENIVEGTSFLLDKWPGYTSLVATTDVTRRSQHPGELVICYGDFPLTAQTIVPLEHRLLRHPIFFERVRHTTVEYHPCWAPVAIIYYLNLTTRRDRQLSVLAELCRMGAPLDRVRAWCVEPNEALHPHLSCAENHTAIVEDFVRRFGGSGKHALILEDDFTFSPDIQQHQQDLASFWERQLNYDACFLAMSKTGYSEPYDDLLRISRQPVTTTAGYLLHANSAWRVAAVFAEGTEKFRETGEVVNYAIDRYWTHHLQPANQMFVFARKMGHQLPSYSDIDKRVVCHWE